MTESDAGSTSGELQLHDTHELRLLHSLQREIERVGSFDRLMHVALRVLVPLFGASHGVALASERGGAVLRVVHQMGDGSWDPDVARQVVALGRATVPPTTLYAALRDRGKVVGVLLLSRPQPYGRAELRVLLRAAEIVGARLEDLSEARVVDVLARIDLKMSRELRTVDLLYQILDGLELLTRCDHSGAILLFDRERSCLEVSAEKIIWRKMKSPHVHRIVPIERDLTELLQRHNRAFVVPHAGAGVVVRPLCEIGATEPGLLEAPAARLAALSDSLRYGGGAGAPDEACMLVVPLLFGPRLLGLLKLSALVADAFTPHDVLVVGRFVEKMSTAIRNANLYGRRLAELRAINDIGKLVTRPLPLEETGATILEIVLRVLHLTAGSIELIDRDGGRLRVLASRGYAGTFEGLALGEGLTGEVAQTGQMILANDVLQHPKYVRRNPDVRSELAVPIVFEGNTVGVLNVESYAPDRFSGRDVDFVSILADKTAVALETLDQREHRRATLQLLHELGAQLVVPEDVAPLLQLVVDLARKHLSCEVASIFMFENGRFRRRATAGVPPDWFADESYGSGEGLTGRAAVPGDSPHLQAIVDNAVSHSPVAHQDVLHQYQMRLATGRIAHLLAVPLVEGDRPIGILRVLNRLTRDGRIVPGGFTASDVTLMTTIASQVSLAIANLKKRERIRKMSARLENQVRQRTEEVHRLASFVENAPLAILEVDAQGVLRFINEAGERMFGYQAAELRDRQVSGDLELLGDAFEDLVKVVEFMGFWAGEITYTRSDGKRLPAFLSARALRDPAGALLGVVIFARDVSAMKDLERQLIEAEGKRAMADLAGGVAHDVNNALGSVLPIIQALASDVDENRFDRAQFLHDLRQIEAYTRLSVRIFQGMLQMSRGTFALDKMVDINERIRTALDILSLRIDKSGVKVHLDLQKDLPPTLAHPGRMEQVVHNLVQNALDAMPEGGTLTLRTRSDGARIALEVEDTGIGIPEDRLERVQEPFYTSKRHGTGLGLSVVRSIVWEHNGTLTIRSTVGKGTTVHIEIPIRSAAPPSEEVGA
jgi:PAS domain S-box-containing protein